MISVSNREIEGKIFNMINSFLPTVPLLTLKPDLYVDYVTMTLRDINDDFVDNLQVRDGVNVAPSTSYRYLDNNSILVMDRNLHNQTVSGLPAILQGYDGNFSVVYHGLSLAFTESSMMITSIDPSSDTLSGYRMSLFNNILEVIIGRASGNVITVNYDLPEFPPYAEKIHTFSFSYIADDGLGISSLRLFWDGISVAYTEQAYVPVVWHTSNGIYVGRYFIFPIIATTYSVGLKVFTKALTEIEMLEQHTNIPRVFNKLNITNSDEAFVDFTIENVNMEGFIIRINSMLPFNTENRSYKVGFLDNVINLVTNTVVTFTTKTTSLIGDPDTFNPYTTLPYDILVTRDLYPDLFTVDTHEHNINVRLLNSDNSLVYQAVHLVTSSPIPTFVLIPDIYTDWATKTLRGRDGNVLDNLDIRRDKIYHATPFEYDLADGDKVLVTNRGIHSQTVSGVLPLPLQGYNGDLSIVFHGLSLINDGTESLILTSIDPNVNQSSYFYSGWYVRVINNQVKIRIAREDRFDIQILAGIIPTSPPYASQLHTLGFVYTADTASISRLEAFWDGVSLGVGTNSRSPLNWDTSNGIYMGRFNDTVVAGKSYNAGFKVFKKALTTTEMLEQHTNRPVLVDKLIVANQDDYIINASFENVTYNGFIVRINEVFPYNTDDRLYKLGFRDEVYDIATNTRVAIGVENLQTNAETPNFDSYALPYDIPISKALYPGLFHTDIHEHRIQLRLNTDTNGLLLEIKELFISPHIPKMPSLLEVDFLQNSQIRFQSLGLADSVVTTSSQSFNFNTDNQFVTLSNDVSIIITPTNWNALVPVTQASLQIKLKLFLPLGPAVSKFWLTDPGLTDAGNARSGPNIRLFGSNENPELRFLLMQERGVNGNGAYSYYIYMAISNIISLVPNLFGVEHEWRFEHKILTGDPDGYTESEIYCDDVLLKSQKFNNASTGEAQRAIGFNQGSRPDNRYNLLLGNTGSKVSYVTINEKPV
jgi:hypothetical protein